MKRLLGFLAAALIATAAQAQNAQYPTDMGNTVAPGYMSMCMSSTGVAVPYALCDTAPGVSAPFGAARPEQRGQVVSISPNSGAANPYPSNATPLTESATGTTAAVVATFPAVPGKKNYLCGVSWSPGSAGTAITSTLVTAGLTNNYTWAVGAPVTAVGTTGTVLTVPFTPCVPASAVNTAITVTGSALSTSGINNDVNAWGYVQ